MIGADDFLRAPERGRIGIHGVVPEIFCLEAWRRGRCRQEMILQLVEAGDEKWDEAAEVGNNNSDVRKTAGNICLQELQHADGVFERGADGPANLADSIMGDPALPPMG